ncbi:MAG: nuclear transport factor 2 family protein [Actinomycetota bacterium]
MAVAVAGVLIGLPSVAVGCGGDDASAEPTAQETADDIRQIERERLRALVAGDIDAASAILADDFKLTTPAGELLSKDKYLELVGGGRLDYVVFEPVSPITVRVQGDKAVITYRSKIGFAGNFGGTTDQSHRDNYERRDGHWLIVRSVTTGAP